MVPEAPDSESGVRSVAAELVGVVLALDDRVVPKQEQLCNSYKLQRRTTPSDARSDLASVLVPASRPDLARRLHSDSSMLSAIETEPVTFGSVHSPWVCPARRAAFLTVSLVFLGCATASEPASAPGKAPADAPVVLSDDGKRYLKDVYLYRCANEYIPYPHGEGPPVPARTDEEWSEREEALTTCRRDVAREYTALETVRALTWNGTDHAMSEAEMQGIARYGDAFLQEYVNDLLEAEMRRGGARQLANEFAASS